MNRFGSLLSGIRASVPLEPKASTFQPGQIFNGKIIKLFPNGVVSLQVGNQKVIAELEAPLDVKHQYWFQVQPGSGKVRLKVISRVTSHHSIEGESSMRSLMENLSLSSKDIKSDTIKFFLREQLPMTQELLEKSGEWLKDIRSLGDGHEAIKFMVQKKLPWTKDTFHACLALLDQDSLTHTIDRLKGLIHNEPLSNTGSKLLQTLQSLSNTSIKMDSILNEGNVPTKQTAIPHFSLNNSTITNLFKQLIAQMGYNYENEMIQWLEQDKREHRIDFILKPLLIDYLKEIHPEPLKNAAQQLLNKITGIQILGSEMGPIGQQIVQIPVFFPSGMVDLTVQWNGRKKNNGQLDPDYCKVFFYLELASLGDTFVDMSVQKRMITISITNENEKIRAFAQPLIPLLKEQLKGIHYTLSNVQFHSFSQLNKKQTPSLYKHKPYSGVDLRI